MLIPPIRKIMIIHIYIYICICIYLLSTPIGYRLYVEASSECLDPAAARSSEVPAQARQPQIGLPGAQTRAGFRDCLVGISGNTNVQGIQNTNYEGL